MGLNNPVASRFHPIISTFNKADTAFLYYFNKSDSTIQFTFMNNEEGEKFVSLASLFNTRISYSSRSGVYLFMESHNFIWIDSPASDSIYQINLNDLKMLKSVKKVSDQDKFELYGFMDQVNIDSKKNEMVLGIYEESDATYGLFEIQNNTLFLKKKLGHLPSDYLDKEMYIDVGIFTKIDKESYLISYHYSDSVDLYQNNSLVKRICLKSDSSISFTGFDGDVKNMNDVKKFFLMNQRYNQLLYNDINKLYYRVFSYAKESDGKIEESEHWSICVFDSSFSKIHEEVFNVYEYYKGYVLFIDSNLYISNSKNSNFKGLKDSSTIVFDNFKLQINEN